MSDERPTHILTIDVDDDGLRYRLACEGVTPACMAYDECDCDKAALNLADEEGDDEPVVHGAVHRYVSFGWGAATGRCWLLEDPDWPEPARDLGLGVGVYRVRHTYEDGGEYYSLSLAADAAEADRG